MSQLGDLKHTIRHQLEKYPQEHHTAIVDTFTDCMEAWDDEFIALCLCGAYRISDIADAEINLQLQCLGLDPVKTFANFLSGKLIIGEE